MLPRPEAPRALVRMPDAPQNEALKLLTILQVFLGGGLIGQVSWRHGTSRRSMHVPCQPQNAQCLDKTEDRVELPKSQAMPGGSREPMVVIVPSLSIRNERHPPTVRRKVVRIKIPVPERVTG